MLKKQSRSSATSTIVVRVNAAAARARAGGIPGRISSYVSISYARLGMPDGADGRRATIRVSPGCPEAVACLVLSRALGWVCSGRMGRTGGEWYPTGKASVVVLLLGLVLAVVAVVVRSWPFAGSAVVLSVVAYTGDKGIAWWEERRKEQALRAALQRKTSLFTSGSTAELPTVTDLSDEQLGVHPARVSVGYQSRDAEQVLVDRVRAGLPSVVVGGALSGKTRMAAEVVRRLCGGSALWFPSQPDGLAARLAEGVPTGCVVWLDHLELYLSAQGLRADWIDQLVAGGNIVVATMGSREHQMVVAGGGVRHPMAGPVERLSVVRLDVEDVKTVERNRLADAMPTDAVRNGVRHYGLGEYLGGGPLVVESYENGAADHPLGAAMLRAAADWRRIGGDRIARDTLSELAMAYLTGHGAEDHEGVEEALTWGEMKVASLLPLLERVDADKYRVNGYLGEYLIGQAGPIPDAAWEAASARAPGQWSALILGSAAYEQGRSEVAARLFERASGGDDPAAAALAWFSVGVIRHERKDLPGAQEAYKAGLMLRDPDYSVTAGTGLAVVRQEGGDLDGAEAAYREAISCARPGQGATPWYGLGVLLEERGNKEAAADALQTAMASTPADRAAAAALRLGDLRRRAGDTTAARMAYQIAMRGRHSEWSPQAAFYLGILYRDLDKPDEAEAAYRVAVDSGHPQWATSAALELAVLCTRGNRLDEARGLCALAVSADDPEVSARALDLQAVLGDSHTA